MAPPPRQPSRPDSHARPIAREDSIAPPRSKRQELPPGATMMEKILYESLTQNGALLDHLGDMTRDVRSRTGKLEEAHDETVERVDKIESWTEDTKTRNIQTAKRTEQVKREWSKRVWVIISAVLSAVLISLALLITSLATRACTLTPLAPTPEQRP